MRRWIVVMALAGGECLGAPFRPVEGLVEVVAGSDFSCARTSLGAVRCWGGNGLGQLGDGTAVDSALPTSVLLGAPALSVAAGGLSACVVAASGQVRCWGSNFYGQLADGTTTSRAAPVTVQGLPAAIRSVSVGAYHACAISEGGALFCWGGNFAGQVGDGTTTDRLAAVAVAMLSDNVAAVSAGAQHTCALRLGEVWCWGSNGTLQLGEGATVAQRSTPATVAAAGSSVLTISSGEGSTCVTRADGGPLCWGYGAAASAISGSFYITQSPPYAVAGLSVPTASIHVGTFHWCGVSGAGALECWGLNDFGMLGNGSVMAQGPDAVVRPLGESVSGVAIARGHTCAITTGQRAYCWGSNRSGQLGDGATTRSPTPVQVRGAIVDPQSRLTVGGANQCLLAPSGRAQCWGDNRFGTVGDGSTQVRVLPVEVATPPAGFASVTSGHLIACGSDRTGRGYCWGNLSGLSGEGGPRESALPYPMPGLEQGTLQIEATAEAFACALREGGAVWCWGPNNGSGELGDGSFVPHASPLPVYELADGVVQLEASRSFACARRVDEVRCWGSNQDGRLGSGSIALRSSVPVAVADLPGAPTDIALGWAHACAIANGGRLYCWGSNFVSQLGDTAAQSRSRAAEVAGVVPPLVRVAAGFAHTCALEASGRVLCWGDNANGQGGFDLAFTRLQYPSVVAGLPTDIVDIAAGGSVSCARQSTGRIWCWGSDEAGALGDGGRNPTLAAQVVESDPNHLHSDGFE